jgi:HSP20 family protein
VNVFGDKDGYTIHLEVPGVVPDDLSIESQGRTLTITGKRTLASLGEGSFHRHERDQGDFSRSLQLPADLDVARADAKCKNGVLTIRVPKREETKPRQITVHAA